ncbi:DUF4397 domain-containing protein [Micromonospora sp. NPDC049559]|uniref:DUF4397 domain-containing protein n=1 Tax=Micromonospora sp. NPDC049559 TaxID=3155923 RepID=UPI00343E8398
MTFPAPRFSGTRRFHGTQVRGALVTIILLATGGTAAAIPGGAAAAPAGAASTGYVRLAHLSPDTPPVDVYLSGPGDGTTPRVFDAVGYGVLSDYLPLPTGRYAVAMRKAGAPASQPPVLTTEVAVTSGAAYTVAGVGRYADLGLRVLDDDLSAPAPGQAKVRVLHASVRAPLLDVAATDGPTIATGVRFATGTAYSQIAPGRWRLRLGATGTAPTSVDVTLSPGTVYSLVVLDAERGGLTTELRTDARGGSVVPSGGVETGGGGLASGGRSGPPYALVVLAAGAILAVSAAAGVVLLRRRARRG